MSSSSGAMRAISAFTGLVYFFAWSLSFYPQPIANYRRHSVSGTCVDFPIANLIGASAYAVYTSCLLFSDTVRREYALRSPDDPIPAVSKWDLAFAMHSVALVSVVLVQFWWYRKKTREDNRGKRPSLWVILACLASILAVLIVICLVGFTQAGYTFAGNWHWLDVVYAVSTLKLVMTLVKFTPQAILNWRRKSTQGWSIYQILLDLTGSVASIVQLGVDSVHKSTDWSSGIMGNLPKLLLGSYSLFFDLIFLYQHYIAYGSKEPVGKADLVGDDTEDEFSPLLG